MNERIMSVTPEHWAAAIEFEPCDAYKATGRSPVLPQPDFINLNDALVEKIYRIGKNCAPVHHRDAALPVFQLEIMPDGSENCNSELWAIARPKDVHDKEVFIYGMTLLFSANSSGIACDIAFSYTDHVGGGYEEIGTVAIMVDGEFFFSFPHFLNDLSGIELYDYESITSICNWLGYLWRGIQHLIINRPELIRIRHHRNSREERDLLKKKGSKTHRVVKVQRIITILLDENDEVEIRHIGSNQITLSVWSVSGHWRTLRSGNRIWISPYYKGKDREKQTVEFHSKEYRFVEEVINHA
jgi:hypothetical protein